MQKTAKFSGPVLRSQSPAVCGGHQAKSSKPLGRAQRMLGGQQLRAGVMACSSRMCYHWAVTERNPRTRICLASTVASKFARFESGWLQHVGNIAREVIQSTRHWSGRTETATENWVGQAGSRYHCGSHSSVASSVGPDQLYVFCTPTLAVIPTYCNQLSEFTPLMKAEAYIGMEISIYFFNFLSTRAQKLPKICR